MQKKQASSVIFPVTIALIAALVMVTVVLYFANPVFFYYVAPCVLIVCVLAAVFLVRISRNTYAYLNGMGQRLKLIQRSASFDYPASIAITDVNGQILWGNELFETLWSNSVVNKSFYGNFISDLFPDLTTTRINESDCVDLSTQDHFYKIIIRKDTKEDIPFLVLHIMDITPLRKLEIEYRMSRPSVMYVCIDNYGELLENARESQKSHIIGEINKLFEDLIAQTTGIMKKLTNDKYMIILEERHLMQLIERRMNVLDKARAIMVGDRMHVTLSIGVGRFAGTLAESEQMARQALDMAFGRGGDQAAVKTQNGYEFYGGISKGIEKQTKVKTRMIAKAVTEFAVNSDKVIIMGHKFGDLDSLGASIGLTRAFRNMGIPTFIAVNRYKNLASVLIDHLTESGNGDFFVMPDEILGTITPRTLLIIVDTHNPDFVEDERVYRACKTVIVIDHHRKMVEHIDNAIVWHHEAFASSTSEMVTELIQYFGNKATIGPQEAEALLSGIMLDTKNFTIKTGVRTFEAAAVLRKIGADTVAVRRLFSSSIDSYQRKSRLVASAEIYKKCAIAISDFTSDDLRIVAPQAADELLGITDVDASFVLYENNGGVNLSARSMGAINVQIIMEMMGGGGHQTMAGAQLANTTTESVRLMLLESIDRYFNSLQSAD